jgi:hypothetical protein
LPSNTQCLDLCPFLAAYHPGGQGLDFRAAQRRIALETVDYEHALQSPYPPLYRQERHQSVTPAADHRQLFAAVDSKQKSLAFQ